MTKLLAFTPHGTAELRENDDVLWSSDADEDFADEGFDDFLSDETDSDDIIDYLIETGELDDDEELDIITEVLDQDDGNEH